MATEYDPEIRDRFRELLIEHRADLGLRDEDIAEYVGALSFLGADQPEVVQIIGPDVPDTVVDLARRAAHEVMRPRAPLPKGIARIAAAPDFRNALFLQAAQGDEGRRRALFAALLDEYFTPTTASVIAGTTPWGSLEPDHQRRITNEIRLATAADES